MLRILPLLLFLLLSQSTSFAQESLSWKKQKKLAEQAYKAGKYAEAAENFEKAWQKHPKDKELIYKAGECYALLKDFKKASQSYRHVKTDNDKFELVGLKYARALKQDGQYEAAKQELIYFVNAYQGGDKTILTQIINTEIKGCEMGLEFAEFSKKSTLEVRHLGENINSQKTEFAPIPYAEDLLYFSSTREQDKAYLFRTQKQKGEWTKAVKAENLPKIADKHLANGSFAPNAERFYFTLCDASSKGNGLTSICEIYAIKRETAGWSDPIRMRDYINEEGSTTTQPWVIHKDGKEFLYFTSNRKGGKGGMDIWLTTRNLNSGDIDFTYPVNLGKQINSMGDEMTPFYDDKAGVLYFSSNGHAGLGGWDIFKSAGDGKNWEQPENLGLPINSSADDFYYVLKPSRKSGFLVSNRLSGLEKISTRHEDLFEFGTKLERAQLYVSGEVLDRESTVDINNVTVYLYELIGGSERLLQTKKTNANTYKFPVLPNKKFRLAIEKKGYLKSTFDFHTGQGTKAVTHDFYLNEAVKVIAPPVAQTNTRAHTNTSVASATYSASTSTTPNTVLQRSSTRPTNTRIATTRTYATAPNNSSNDRASTTITVAPNTSTKGVYYKVQLIAVNRHNAAHARYRDVKNLARLETEAVPNKGLTRVLLATFYSKDEARAVKAQAQQYGFADAFMVKYRDGKRLGTVFN